MSNKNLSLFGQAAVALDEDFVEAERLASQIEQVDVQSEIGLERAIRLLRHFTECGERITSQIQSLAQELEKARSRTEGAAQTVARRAAEIQIRKEQEDQGLQGFKALSEKVREITAEMSELKQPKDKSLSADEKKELSLKMAGFDSKIVPLIDEANRLKDQARNSKMKTLERNAESLSQNLVNARKKLSAFTESPVLH